MPEITIDVPDPYDKEVNRLRIDRNIRSKKVMIEEIIKEYFDKKMNKKE